MASNLQNKIFLLDTCIIQDVSSKELSNELLKILFNVIHQGGVLRISKFAIYELLRGASQSKAQKGEESLRLFGQTEVSGEVLRAASKLETFYREEKINQGISDGDKIIAATAVLTDSMIVTRDGQDFPRPFFEESSLINRKLIEYNKSGRRIRIVAVYFLEPNYSVLLNRLESNYPEYGLQLKIKQ